MTNRARILTCGNCHGFDQLVAQLGQLHLDVLGWAEVGELSGLGFARSDVDVVLYACGPASVLRDDLEQIRAATDAPVVVLVGAGSASVLEDAFSAGAADVLLLPQPPETVLFAIMKASRGPRSGPREHRAKIITVMSPKGGTGKTVISTNLAAALALQGTRTLLLDLDLQFGDAAIMLGLEPEKTLYDLVVGPGELDAEKLAAFTTAHESGLDIIPAPLRPEDAELVSEHRLARLLEVARTCYDVIVVDTSPYFHAPMLATLDRTDEILLLCAAFDVPTLKNVRLSLQTLALLSFPQEKINLVLNRFSPKMDIRREEVEAALEAKTRYELPNDRAVPRCVNIGKPVVLNEPAATFARALVDLAREFAPPRSEPAEVVAAEDSEPPAQATQTLEERLPSWLRSLIRRDQRPRYPRPMPESEPVGLDEEPAAPVVEAVEAQPRAAADAAAAGQSEPARAMPEAVPAPAPAEVVPAPVRQPPPSPSPARADGEVAEALHTLIEQLKRLGEIAGELGRAVERPPADEPVLEELRRAGSAQ